ncbi:MAG: YggS family pyridoxal phosphate enzyme [Actinomycetota bacterium]|jgi:hypothetical protein|nr:YggS family pyridoxal phosphate enzyme [Actinomycetota bacterium]
MRYGTAGNGRAGETGGGPSAPDVAAAITRVRERIAGCGRDPAAVRLVAVTKGFGPEAVRAVRDAGVVDVGENYAGELEAKADVVRSTDGDAAEIRWHFLGAVQRRKVPRLAKVVSLWQGVCRVEEGQAIARHAPGASVLVQVNVDGAPGRNGCPPGAVADLVAALRDQGLDVAGLMVVAPNGSADDRRHAFEQVAAMADALDLPVRSMGMSDDLELAVLAGSTMVRVGRALFGPRPAPGPG